MQLYVKRVRACPLQELAKEQELDEPDWDGGLEIRAVTYPNLITMESPRELWNNIEVLASFHLI